MHEWGELICKGQSVFAHALRDCSRLLHAAQQNSSASFIYLPFSIRQPLDLPTGVVEVMYLLDCDLREMVEFDSGEADSIGRPEAPEVI
jgi:hypothetical protein